MKSLSILVVWPVLVAGLLAYPNSATAQTEYWDPLNTGGTGSGGPGDWFTGTPWYNGVSDAAWVTGNAFFEGASGGTVTLSTGVTVDGLTFTTTGYTLSGSTITMASSPTTITAPSAGTATILSTLAGTGGLTESGSGTLILSGANTYTGGTTVSGGTLDVGTGVANGSGSIAGNVTVTAAGTLELDNPNALAANVVLYLPATPNNGQVNLNFTGTLNVSAFIVGSFVEPVGTYTASGGGGTVYAGPVFTGTGTLNVTGAFASAYWDPSNTGGTGSGGTGNWNTTSSFWYADNAEDTVWYTGAVADFAGTGATVTLTSSINADGLTFTSTGYTINTNSGTPATLTLGGSPSIINLPATQNETTTISSPLTVSSGLTLTGAPDGVLNLTGSSINITGNIMINSGTLQIGGSAKLNGGTYAGNIITMSNNLYGANGTIPAVFNWDSSGAQTLSGVISGTGLIAQNGTGTLTLKGANTYTGWTTIDHGSVALGVGGSIVSPLIAIYYTGTFDVSAQPSPYNFTSSVLVGVGAGAGNPLIKCATGGTVNLGSQQLLFYAASTALVCLEITNSTVTTVIFNNNPVAVTNPTAAPFAAGTYPLLKVGNGSTGVANGDGVINGSPNLTPIVIGGGNGWGSGIPAGDVATFAFGTGSTATELVMKVTAATVATTTTISGASDPYGSVSATVTPASGTLHSGGYVQFFGNGGALGSPVAVSGGGGTGVATLPQQIAVGTYTLFSAYYTGSSDGFNGASSSTTGAGVTLTITNNWTPITNTTTTVVGTGLQVCWESIPGVYYNVLTNGDLTQGQNTPGSWIDVGNESSPASPVLATGTTTCVTILNPLPSTNLFVLIKQNNN